jgi:hypothetical protein
MRAETKFYPALNLVKTPSSKVHTISQSLRFFGMTVLLFRVLNPITMQGYIFFEFLRRAQGETAALFG